MCIRDRIRSPDPVKITNGTKYYFTVKAVNISGPGPASDEASATPAPVPGAPQDLAATSTGGSVTLTWSAEQGVSGYDLYQGTAPGPASAAPTTLAASATSDTLTGLKVGVTHYFYLTAVNSAGQSLPSAEASAEPVGAPSAPAVTVDPGIGSVKVSWQKPQDQGSPVTGYTPVSYTHLDVYKRQTFTKAPPRAQRALLPPPWRPRLPPIR